MDTLLQSVRLSNPYVIAILKNSHNVAILKKCSRQMRSDISLPRSDTVSGVSYSEIKNLATSDWVWGPWPAGGRSILGPLNGN